MNGMVSTGLFCNALTKLVAGRNFCRGISVGGACGEIRTCDLRRVLSEAMWLERRCRSPRTTWCAAQSTNGDTCGGGTRFGTRMDADGTRRGGISVGGACGEFGEVGKCGGQVGVVRVWSWFVSAAPK